MDFEIRLQRCALALAEHRNFGRAAPVDKHNREIGSVSDPQFPLG